MTHKEKAIAHFQTWSARLYEEARDHTRNKYSRKFFALMAMEKSLTSRILMGIEEDVETD